MISDAIGGVIEFIFIASIGLIINLMYLVAIGVVVVIEGFTDTLFDIDNVFYVENIISKGDILFDKFFDVSLMVALSLTTVKFLQKILYTYGLGTEGDDSVLPIRLIFGFVQSIIIMMSYALIYKIFTKMVLYVFNQFSSALTLVSGIDEDKSISILIMTRYDEVRELLGDIELPTDISELAFLLIEPLIIVTLVAMAVFLNFKIIKVGIEIFILRVIFPFATLGLMDSDKGMYANWFEALYSNTITVVVQIIVAKIAFATIDVNTSIFIPLVLMFTAITAPQGIEKLIKPSSHSTGASTTYKTASWLKGKIF